MPQDSALKGAGSLTVSTNYRAALGPFTGIISQTMTGNNYITVSNNSQDLLAGVTLSDLTGGTLIVNGNQNNTILGVTLVGNNIYSGQPEYSVHISGDSAGATGGTGISISIAKAATKNDWAFGTNGSLTLPQGSAIDETTGVSANIKVNGKAWAFGTNGKLTLPAGGDILNSSGNSVLGTDRVTGSWTLASGANTVSLTVPINGTYSIWVRGNIPSGIVSYTATVVVTNTNVPVLGTSYGWYYVDGNQLVLTSIPTQIIGTVNNISTASVSTTTANVFTFGITNNSGTAQVVNWGYTRI